MEKTKVQKSEAFSKIVKCILSCKTTEQVESCYKMIKFYNNLFADHKFDIKSEVDVLTEELQSIEKNIK